MKIVRRTNTAFVSMVVVATMTVVSLPRSSAAFSAAHPCTDGDPYRRRYRRAEALSGFGGRVSSSLQATAGVDDDTTFAEFGSFLLDRQEDIIAQLEGLDVESGAMFTRDEWGAIGNGASGGVTRVLQGGSFIEKGACSVTTIRNGVLSKERAGSIQGRKRKQQQQDHDDILVQEGDKYSAAALSMVLHSRSPLVPTFRSDVRIFLVQSQRDNSTLAWFGGGADLTPYYLHNDDVTSFHQDYQELCRRHFDDDNDVTYRRMKQDCDTYFYLPARAEHRGTGGVFFDDLAVVPHTTAFVRGLVDTWMPSWLPIVARRHAKEYTAAQRDWQLLRRGRYLEFNLLYDRGVRFGLASENPRVEGVMVSAPPLVAWEYRHEVEEGSPEDRLMKVLQTPRDWV